MKRVETVKTYRVGNSQVVRVPSKYRVNNKAKAKVYCDDTPDSKMIIYKFPKKHHYKNIFKSKLWKNMNPQKTKEMTKKLGYSGNSGLRGNERWHY